MTIDHGQRTALAAILAVGCAVGSTGAASQDGALAARSAAETSPPFGGPASVQYAQSLWSELARQDLVGPAAIRTYPYEGTPPHGAVLEYLDTEVSVDGVTGAVMVKRNYVKKEGMDAEAAQHAILDGRPELLDSVTVMFRRETGYDPDHRDWFWAKYRPDGSLAANPEGTALAGRVAKGAGQGCIACHQAAPGGDYVYTHDRWAGQ